MARGATPTLDLRLPTRSTLGLLTCLTYVLLISGAIIQPLLAPGGAETIDLDTGLPGVQVMASGLLAVIALLTVSHFWRRPVGRPVLSAWLPLLFTLLAAASVLWSMNPELTMRRSVALAGTVLVAIYAVWVLGYRRTIALVMGALALAALASVVVVFLAPEFGVHQVGSHTGRWKGVFLHKNLLGREMALASGLFLLAAFQSRRFSGKVAWAAMATLAASLVVQAQSATGLVALLAAVIAVLALRLIRWQPRLIAATFVLFLLAATALTTAFRVAPDELFSFIGRDASVTGRTTLWSIVIDEIGERPVLGHGYRAYWGSKSGAAVTETLGWRVGHAHNSLLDVGLSLGTVGMLLILGLLLSLLKRWFTSIGDIAHSQEIGVVVVVTSLVVSMSDSILLGPNNLFLLLLFVQFIGSSALYRGVVPDEEPAGEARIVSRRPAEP